MVEVLGPEAVEAGESADLLADGAVPLFEGAGFGGEVFAEVDFAAVVGVEASADGVAAALLFSGVVGA